MQFEADRENLDVPGLFVMNETREGLHRQLIPCMGLAIPCGEICLLLVVPQMHMGWQGQFAMNYG